MTTLHLNCKKCGRVHTVKGPDCFYNTMSVLGDIYGFAHAIRHHWAGLSLKARLWSPFYCIALPLRFALAVAWDLLRVALLVATWPFWWLHEEVL